MTEAAMIDKVIRGRAVKVALSLMAALALSPGGLGAGSARAAERVGGDFTLERVDLRFVGGEKVRVLAAGQVARAEAEITFTGTGQLGGAWEIAEPSTASGSPRFRTLELVSRLLGMGRHELLTSPPLPTASPGTYQLRLRITTPETAGSPLLVRYFVGQPHREAATAPAASPGTLAAHGPAAGSRPDNLQFSWQPVAGSIAYQLEFYEKDPGAASGPQGAEDADPAACLVSIPSPLGRPPVAGIMVPGTATGVALSHAVAGKLAAGTTYLWRVVAFDGGGKVLCDSPLKELVR